MGSLKHQLAITTSELKMKFLIAFSAVLAVALAAPANVYSPYLLQDLAYQSVDANEDGQIDQAISITHPTQIMRTIATTMPAPKWEVKQIETPAELKALPMTYAMQPMMFRSALTSEIKTDIPELKTLPMTCSYGTYPFAPFTIVKTAEKSE